MSSIFGTDGSPWLQRADWAAKQSNGQDTRQAIVWWIIPALVAPFTLGLTYIAIAGTFSGKNSLKLCLGIMGVALFFWAIEGLLMILPLRETLRLRRYGNPCLKLAAVPVPLGGVLRGEIAVGTTVPATSRFTLNLHCIRYFQRSLDGNVPDKIVLWQKEKVVTSLSDGRVPVSFLIPVDGMTTTTGVLWRLRVSSSMDGRGVPFRNQYQIPVFQAPLSLSDEREAEALQTENQSELEAYHPSGNSRIHVNALPNDKTEFYFEAGRAPGLTFLLVAMALTAWILSLAPMLQTASVQNHMPGWFSAVFFGLGIILFFAAMDALWGTKQVVIGAGQMVIKDTLGFISMGLTTIPADDVVSIKSEAKFTATWGTVYNRLVVTCRDGTAVAGSLIAETKESEWLAMQMFKRLQK